MTTALPSVDEAGGFGRAFVAALTQRPRCIAPKYFYDACGSALFDRICELPEYYPTRTELGILRARATECASLMGPQVDLIEFGAGSLHKVRLLLDALPPSTRYLPIDISGLHLAQAAAQLEQDYPQLLVQPVVADYSHAFSLPSTSAGRRRIGFFPGSTLGNFTPAEALAFLQRAAVLLQGGALLLGTDLVKDPAVLHAAYNDAQGVTAAFNRNLLRRAQRELQAELAPEGFAHSAFYNAPLQRVEMHLMSLQQQRIWVAGQGFEFEEGATLHTENSYKFTVAQVQELAQRAGFEAGPCWLDEQGWFALHWLYAPSI